MRLEIKNISKTFTNKKEVNNVLEDISFNVGEGEFVTLLGPSGCGKTTLLTIIAGFQNPSSGEIFLNGNKVTKPGPDRGFVFQNYALFPWMTVKENITYPMKQLKLSKNEQEERLQNLLKIAQLQGKENLYPHQISGGMKQRTAVVRSLASKPEVLLMDEPLGAVDFQMRQILQKQLEDMWMKDKTTVVMVTHDVDEAVYLSDRVIVMSDKRGTVVEDIKIDISRPRDRNSKQYDSYKKHLMGILKIALTKNQIENEVAFAK
ncbi:ABC-type nitrate/sulfonate/bicarbonate transport system, ATPase component [Gottschalkia purinilytica]|uniref:ABC-type quaternary amine transporter n=1 Tax=Gottschalkia purinilytica TaxID=1503 RepID=A0A0L0WA84_GOTPU|nr:ABC transporter ATP-binding protein SaoA [Gottschalkia purinilytica]KNF08391.1 ABC-type nitrate/sulfonate/bicarbonate transport system, ATPase component [Gottschalkia purinilytica]